MNRYCTNMQSSQSKERQANQLNLRKAFTTTASPEKQTDQTAGSSLAIGHEFVRAFSLEVTPVAPDTLFSYEAEATDTPAPHRARPGPTPRH